jgi:hypothetical protein
MPLDFGLLVHLSALHPLSVLLLLLLLLPLLHRLG